MSAAKITLSPPEVIAGRYRIEGKLGQGGMGSVWRAQHLSLRSPVAIKLIDPSLADSEGALVRFLREAQAAAALRSPHVVQILDHGVDHGVPYIAMELLVGESLADRLFRVQKLRPAETARVMTHVARAMTLAHAAGIVHRDLKPDNVFLVRNDDEEIAKVLDFGVAKAPTATFEITSGTRTGAMLGTPQYMSPEQAEGSPDIDYRTDLWAMAVIAFECLTGAKPFDSDTLGALLLQICSKPIPVPSQVGEVPAGFDEWFAHATQRVPAKRFQSAREMADALRVVLTSDAPQRTRRSRMLPLMLAGCVALLAAAALLLGRSPGEKLKKVPVPVQVGQSHVAGPVRQEGAAARPVESVAAQAASTQPQAPAAAVEPAQGSPPVAHRKPRPTISKPASASNSVRDASAPMSSVGDASVPPSLVKPARKKIRWGF